MIHYEVNLTVDNDIANDYGVWLAGHVDEMIAIDGFTGAQTLRVVDPDDPQHTTWSVRYRLESEASLEAYMTHHASRMRQQAIDRFGERFTASRRVLTDAS